MSEGYKSACIFGAPGSGKTTLAESIIADYEKRGGRFDILDPHGNFAHHPRARWWYNLPKGQSATEKAEEWLRSTYGKGPRGLLLDDLDGPIGLHATDFWRDFFSGFRHWQCDLLITARRSQGVPKELVAGSQTIYQFRMMEPGAIKYLADLLNLSREEVLKKLPTKEYEYTKIEPFTHTFAKGKTKKRTHEVAADKR